MIQHSTEAGLIEQAIPYWRRAGQQARQRSANLEAVRHLITGLEVLATLPETRRGPSRNPIYRWPWDRH